MTDFKTNCLFYCSTNSTNKYV